MAPLASLIDQATQAALHLAALRHSCELRIFSLDGGYVVLDCTPGSDALIAAARHTCEWRGYHLTAIVDALPDASQCTLDDLARAVQAFARVYVCERASACGADGGERTRGLEAAVQQPGRVECQFAGDLRRALRRCIDGMLPGDIIVYCCDAVEGAQEILESYGATAVEAVPEMRDGHTSDVGMSLALSRTAGARATAHSERV